MLQVRCEGGTVSTVALRAPDQISTEFASGTANICD